MSIKAEMKGGLDALSAVLKMSRANKTAERVNKYFNGSVCRALYYRYLEFFHTVPATIQDMVDGIKYMHLMNAERK